MNNYIRLLAKALESQNHCLAAHIASHEVKEVFEGIKVAWEGVVEEFKITGHPKANKCYAWGFEDKKGEMQYTTVLEIPPVDSPETAVKVAIAGS